MNLTSQERAYLRGEAQTLNPVVMVGKEGLTDAVAKALDEAVKAHELVKVRFQAHKDEVKTIAFDLAERSNSTLVATTGFTAVYYRPAEKAEDRRYFL
ncbi:MAG: YhbY family RNA-binding protein [Spirochaetales bacterium]|nr:YhbY family RNA-binding protein [Spirochaetales bacterium]